jgi:endonuclease G
MSPEERTRRLKAMLTQVAGDKGLESISPPTPPQSQLRGLESIPDAVDTASTALEKLKSGKPLSPTDFFGLEAIVLPDKRPVVFIRNNVYEPVPMNDWAHLNKPDVHHRLEPLFPSIGRIELPLTPTIPYGGTGFVVGSDLLMTNRHVARLFSEGLGVRVTYHAGGSAVDFLREDGLPEPDPGTLLRVIGVVMVHPFWDMALLKVAGLPATAKPLPISVMPPEQLSGRDVVVVGYPAQDFRNDQEVQSRVFGKTFGVKRFQPGKVQGRSTIPSFENQVSALTHDSSTLGGNSGSAVIDVETGAVVGLHFAGIYLEANYAVPMHELARDSRVVDTGLNFQGSVAPTTDWSTAWARTGEEKAAPTANPSASSDATQPVNQIVNQAAAAGQQTPPNEIEVTIPLHVTVRVGTPQYGTSCTATATAGGSAPAQVGEEKIEINTDYSDREGYDPAFLGGGIHRVPLPKMTPTMIRAAAVNLEPLEGALDCELQYHHYSVIMNAKRRLAFFTAVNIDGTLEKNLGKRENDRWIFDKRLDANLQIGNKWYGRPFDRGHLVRRLDPAWGRTAALAKTANDDTFHFTNCSPQHSRFNQGKNLWQGLENHLLDTTNDEERRLTVFTGPIFEKDDPEYEGVQIPKRYWKVATWVRKDNSMGAAGFIVSQEALLASIGLESTAEEVARTYQVRIREIESATKLNFGKLSSFDTFKQATPLETVETAPAELQSFDQIQL